MPAKARFTREQLQAAALAIVDERGLAALSMRSLAEALGTGAMTVYNYVRDRDELDALLVEAVMAEARLPAGEARDDWREEVQARLGAVWRAVRAHPNAIPLILTRRTSHETSLEVAEALLRALARSGRSGPALLAAFRTLTGFIMGLAQAQLTGAPADSPDARPDPHAARVEGLPDDRFPKLREIAGAARHLDSEQEFQAGLAILLAGLAAQGPSPPTAGQKPGPADGAAAGRGGPLPPRPRRRGL